MNIGTILKWLLLVPAGLLGLVLLIVLPFIVLIKGAIISYDYGLSTHMSLFAGSIATFIVLLVYLIAIDRAARRRFYISLKIKLFIAGLVVVSFNGYALFVLADENVKNRRIANEYTEVHPILRIGVRTWSLFDPGLVITDMTRRKRDYRRMRVRYYRKSLHFRQKDGYVHAVDLRTKRRSKFRNWITETVFRMMGFGTLRHVGTADHLHVQLGMSKKQRIPRGLTPAQRKRILARRRARAKARRRARLARARARARARAEAKAAREKTRQEQSAREASTSAIQSSDSGSSANKTAVTTPDGSNDASKPSESGGGVKKTPASADTTETNQTDDDSDDE